MAGHPRRRVAGLFFARLFFGRQGACAAASSAAMFDLHLDAGLARLTLRRPEARNAIPAAQWAALERVINEAEAGGARVLLVLGEGSAFCAGADISDFAGMRGDEGARAAFRLDMRAALDRLRAAPFPTIAVVEGHCFGAGVALAMACDIRIAAPAARFAITPAKFGISYPQEDVHRLISLVGPGQAARLLLGALPIDAAEAQRIGLVEMPGGVAEAEALGEAMLAGSSASHAALKQAIALAEMGTRSDAAQDQSFDDLLGSDDLAQRLAKLRPPR
jgi:enoyl-CoA hydratase/carnithine racemase